MRILQRFLAVAGVFLACSDPFTPTVENVAGTYTLERLTEFHGTVGATNWVPRGGTMTITLETNGTTTGRLFLPGADESGADFDVDMAGTWTLIDGIVVFNQSADSFVRDARWVARRSRITGDHTLGDDRVIAVLSK